MVDCLSKKQQQFFDMGKNTIIGFTNACTTKNNTVWHMRNTTE